jgi:hypothetical protein
MTISRDIHRDAQAQHDAARSLAEAEAGMAEKFRVDGESISRPT